MTPDPTITNSPGRIRLAWSALWANRTLTLVTVVVAVLFALYHVSMTMHFDSRSAAVNTYWANFWLIAYSDGYERRALLGQIIRLCFPEQISYVTLNALAFTCAGLCLALAFATLFTRFIHLRHWGLFFVILACGPSTTVFFEVLGDPLHVAILLTFACLIACSCWTSSVARWLMMLVTALSAILIHEAAIFLLVPALYLAHRIAINRKPGIIVIGVIVLTLAGLTTYLLNAQTPSSNGLALLTKKGGIYHASANVLPPLSKLLKSELTGYFGSLAGVLHLAFKIAGAFLWPILCLMAIGHLLGATNGLRYFLYLFVLSSPLYVIAHDWGRFAVYTLWLSLMIVTLTPPDRDVRLPFGINAISNRLFAWSRCVFENPFAAVGLIVMFFAHKTYRIDGLTRQNVAVVVGALIVVLIHKGFSKRWRSVVPTGSEESGAH